MILEKFSGQGDIDHGNHSQTCEHHNQAALEGVEQPTSQGCTNPQERDRDPQRHWICRYDTCDHINCASTSGERLMMTCQMAVESPIVGSRVPERRKRGLV